MRSDVSRWDADGNVRLSFSRRPAWFRHASVFNYDWKTEPSPSGCGADDAEGLVWLVVRVPSRTWKEAWPNVPANVGEVPGRLIKSEKLFGTMIEVIDPRVGRVVSRGSFDWYVVGALPGRRAAIYQIDDTGQVRVAVVSLEVVGR